MLPASASVIGINSVRRWQHRLRHGENTSAKRWQPMTPLTATQDLRTRVLLLGAGDRENVQLEAERLRPVIRKSAEIVLDDLESRADISSISADFAIVLGGDGSILRAAKRMHHNQIPVIGINLGKLGFLADLLPDELIAAWPDVCAGQYTIVEHLMLECSIMRGEQTIACQLGLNEMSIQGGPPYSIMDLELYVDAELATTYSCDGLIISTPVGSTAHNLSAGGPILRKDLQAFVIAAISPHTLTVRPVIDSAERTYEIVVRDPHANTSVVVDGQPLCRLTAEDRVRVVRAAPRFKLVEVAGHNYYRTLREKLGWGGNLREIDAAKRKRR